MKKIVVTLFVFVLIVGLVIFGIANNSETTTNSEVLRIHIRANSNESVDQNVKYKVKDAVVSAMLPFLSTCTTKEEAETKIKQNFSLIESTANSVLKESGFSYTAKAKLTSEEFPTRAYGEYVYEAGFYDALILELGSGTGNNWWCVVYPPLCFLQTNSPNEVKYTSKLAELVKNLFKTKE